VKVDNLTITATATTFLSTDLTTMDLHVSGTQASQPYNILVQSSVTEVPTTPPPQTLSWIFTSSSILTGLVEKAQGWVDQSDVVFATGGATTGSLTAPASGSKQFSYIPSYSFTEQYSLVGTGHRGFQVGADNNEMISNAPAPAGLALALAGMPGLGLGAWIRRRRIGLESTL